MITTTTKLPTYNMREGQKLIDAHYAWHSKKKINEEIKVGDYKRAVWYEVMLYNNYGPKKIIHNHFIYVNHE